VSNALPPIPPRRPRPDGELPHLAPRAARTDELPTIEARRTATRPNLGGRRERASEPREDRPSPPRTRSGGPTNRTFAAGVAVILTAALVGAGSARLVAPDGERSAGPNTPISTPTSDRGEEGLKQAISSVQSSVVEVRARGVFSRSQGSGVIVRPSGLIVTNHHVIGGSDRVEVVTATRQSIQAEVVARNEAEDLAILRPVGTAGPGVELADDTAGAPASGTTVFAVGSPFGLQNTVTAGVVSAFRQEDGQPLIQFDAPVNPGNSGGGLFDLDGRLLGIPTSIRSPVEGNVGIGFAVPSSRVRAMLARVN